MDFGFWIILPSWCPRTRATSNETDNSPPVDVPQEKIDEVTEKKYRANNGAVEKHVGYPVIRITCPDARIDYIPCGAFGFWLRCSSVTER